MAIGRHFVDTGDYESAFQCYMAIVKMIPDHAEAWAELAVILLSRGEVERAYACCRTALEHDPRTLLAHEVLVILLQRGSPPALALASLRRLAALAPDHPALANMSLLLSALGERVASLTWAWRGVALNPQRGEVWNTLGNALRSNGLFPNALVAWAQAVAVDPALANAHGNLAALLRDMEHPREAEQALRRALRLDPSHAGLLNSLVHILQGQNRQAEARAACRRALALAPAYADGWCNMALLEQQADRRTLAMSLFRRVLELDRTHALAGFDLGLLALERGQLALGWDGYERRFAAGQARPVRRFAVPPWNGQPIPDKRLLIWREQGVGDEFLFASCYRDAIAAAGHVVIECDPRLAGLFARSFPAATVRPERRQRGPVVERTDADLQIAAGSLPALTRRSLIHFPPSGGWLVADPARVDRWTGLLERAPSGVRVGIAWRSLLVTLNRRGAYAPLAAWGAVLRTPGITFINLQHGVAGEEIAAVERLFGTRIVSAPWLDLRDDFEEVAALVSCLDLVIAPAVSVAELAGALGVPVWRFGARDWTGLGTGVRPWYPTMRAYQPAPGEGLAGALDQIAGDLGRLGAVGGHRPID